MLRVLIEKCLVHAKPLIKQKAFECVLTMFEISESFQDDSIQVLEEMLQSKKLPVRILTTFIISILGLNRIYLIISSIIAKLWDQEIPNSDILITN